MNRHQMLLVEDHEETRTLLRKILSLCGGRGGIEPDPPYPIPAFLPFPADRPVTTGRLNM
jgi:hypothetical protein